MIERIGSIIRGEWHATARLMTLAVLASLCTLALVASPASALSQRGYAFSGSFGKEGMGAGEMRSPQGVAVNQETGDIYVVDAGNNRVDRFTSAGTFVEAWGWGVKNGEKAFQTCTTTTKCQAGLPGHGKGQLHSAEAIAIDNNPKSPSHGDVYVEAVTPYVEGEKEFEEGIVDKFTKDGKLVSELKGFKEKGGFAEKFEEPHGLTVNTQGELLVYNEEDVVEFTGEEKNKFLALIPTELEGGGRPGIATDSGGNFYLGHSEIEEEAAPTVIAKDSVIEEGGVKSGLPLLEALDPENTTGVAVDPNTQNVFLDNATNVAMVAPNGSIVQRFGAGEGVTLHKGAGLATRADAGEPKLSDVLVADAGSGVIDLFVPEPAGAPRIDELGAANTTATSAELTGVVDPHGEASEYFFRYSSEAVPAASAPCNAPCVEVPVPPGTFGAAGQYGDVTLAPQALSGLSQLTTYDYVLFAHNAKGAVASPEQKFRTRPAQPGEVLPDHRGWAVVSPKQKNGGFLEGITREGGTIQASLDGTGMTYVSTAPTEGSEGNRSPEYNQLLSTRHENAGGQQEWSTEDLTTPINEAEGFSPGTAPEYRIFSTDLSVALLKTYGESDPESPQLSSEATERTIYQRNNLTCASSRSTCFTPLVDDANVTSEPKSHYGSQTAFLQFLSSNESGHQSVLEAGVPLTTEPMAKGRNLYETSGGHLKVVNILPEGTPAENAQLGAGPNRSYLVRHAISADGSRVIFNTGAHLYMRDVAAAKTVQVDAPEAGLKEEPGFHPSFQDASETEGKTTTIFFTDEAKLVVGAGAREHKPDLYACDIEGEASAPKCHLTDLTAGTSGSEAAWVQGVVPGAASDGSDVFFVADGALAENAKPGNCVPELLSKNHGSEQTFGNTCNLYVEHRNPATKAWMHPELIREVSIEDEPDWGAQGFHRNLVELTSRVSPNGEWLAFMSDRSLTGYNNHDLVSGRADEEVFLYNATTKKTVCASCDPTGARPQGVHDVEESGEGIGLLVDAPDLGEPLARRERPRLDADRHLHALYQSRYLSNSGRLFFDSAEALVPQDHNHTRTSTSTSPPEPRGRTKKKSARARWTRSAKARAGASP